MDGLAETSSFDYGLPILIYFEPDLQTGFLDQAMLFSNHRRNQYNFISSR